MSQTAKIENKSMDPSITAAYVHVPFCSHKCEFCDFAAFAGLDHLENDYFDVVCDEIGGRISQVSAPIRLSTIYFGGGTPGLASPDNIARALSRLEPFVDHSQELEISLETTPHAITTEKLEHWRRLGINRLSIGFESLHDGELVAMGRDHSRKQALDGLTMAVAAGFENISLDFMYGLPTQSLESWQATLEEVVSLSRWSRAITHISSYGLQLADNSPLYSRFPRQSSAYPDDDSFADMFFHLAGQLTAAGFLHYEVSNFARPGFQCRHNLVYWQNLPYLAFGVGAHRYVDGWRSSNWRSLKRYMREPMGSEMSEFIDGEMRVREAIMLGLRMREGIELESFRQRYGVNLEKSYAAQIARLSSDGFLQLTDNRLRLSDKAVPVSNSVLVEFM